MILQHKIQNIYKTFDIYIGAFEVQRETRRQRQIAVTKIRIKINPIIISPIFTQKKYKINLSTILPNKTILRVSAK